MKSRALVASGSRSLCCRQQTLVDHADDGGGLRGQFRVSIEAHLLEGEG